MHRRTLASLLALAALSAAPCDAQVRASEIGSVSQIVDGTKLTLEYSRPRARGRTTIFGTSAVHWNEVWTPGANWATTLDVSKDVTMNGRAVPKGKYSMWIVVRQSGDWTVVLEPDVRRYHMEPPDSSAKQVRIAARADSAPFTDVLTWSFPEIRMNGGVLAMAWERRRVKLDFEVQPTLSVTMPQADAAPYLGTYEYVEHARDGRTRTKQLTVLYENGTLKAEFAPVDRYLKRFALVRTGPDVFAPGVYDEHGVVYEVYRPEMMFTFKRVNGRAESFEVREEDDFLAASGKRKP